MSFTVEKENTGMIFKNEKNNERQPDYKGQVNVRGEQLEVAMWIKEGAKGKYFSVKFSEPYVKPDEIDSTIGMERERNYQPVGDSGDVPF
ncbi:MAG: DUF736 domain-containing protein [Acidobacteriota bacterium]|nr:DUF736 domain-containing protein [Acidobacteriota bacterium]